MSIYTAGLLLLDDTIMMLHWQLHEISSPHMFLLRRMNLGGIPGDEDYYGTKWKCRCSKIWALYSMAIEAKYISA
jgi:hypothetical protein